MKNKIAGIILILITLSCQTDKTPLSLQTKTKKPIHYTKTISGYVQMEHQTNHDNCAVFLDRVNIGTYTDSSGFYHLALPDTAFENDTLKVQGQVKLYFYSYNFYLDSLLVALGGKGIIQDSLDVDINGKTNQILIKQIVKVELLTDTTYYQIGDTIKMELYLTSMTEDTFYCTILHAASFGIGPIYLIHENGIDWYIIFDPINAEYDVVFTIKDITGILDKSIFLYPDFFNNPPGPGPGSIPLPEGYYYILPHIGEINLGWPSNKSRYIPFNLARFLPPYKYLGFEDYYPHPKKFIIPKVFLSN